MEAVYFLIHVIKHIIRLSFSQKPLPLQCVFHSIRFKVNKGWSSAELLFLCPYVSSFPQYRVKNVLMQMR